jgi:FkbM family methyltransferase
VLRGLPIRWRRAIRSIRLQYLVRTNQFHSEEPEYRRLSDWLKPGDVAIDVGANFGSFSLRMAQLVGTSGRVFSFEPVPQTFAMLVQALSARGCQNVHPMNLACSSTNSLVTMTVPADRLSGENLYQAAIAGSGPSLVAVACVRIDDLPLPLQGLKFVKIDAEGHDGEVIVGMWETIRRHRPIICVEHPPEEISSRLSSIGYTGNREPGSPNTVFLPRPDLPPPM